MTAPRTIRLIVTGRVQGVGYRFWAERMGRNLGLRGWVRNRADGTVEILATGADEAVSALVEACGIGPRAATVAAVELADAADDGSTGFAMAPTA